MNSRLERIGVVFWLLLLLAGLSVGAWLSDRYNRPADTRRNHALNSYNRWGTAALGELLQIHGFEARQWRQRLTGLSPDHRALVILSPSRQFTRAEVSHLLDWIAHGGVLLTAAGTYAISGGEMLATDSLPPVAQLLGPLGLSAVSRPEAGETALPLTELPLLRDVAGVRVPSEIRLHAADEQALAEAYPEAAESEHLQQFLQPRVGPDSLTALLGTGEDGAVACLVSHGDGWVLALAEADLLGNYWIAREHNAVLALNFAYLSGADAIYFDHYHHGLSFLSVEGQEALAMGTWRVVALALAAVALFLIGQAVRFGSAVPLQRRRRRSAREFVQALAQLYMQAGAAASAVQILSEHLKRRVAACGRMSLHGPTAEVDNRQLADRCAALNPHIRPEQLHNLLDILDAAQQRRLGNAELLRLARAVASMESRIAHARQEVMITDGEN